jgi:hypothetical protein
MIRRRGTEFCRFANHLLTANPVFPGIGPDMTSALALEPRRSLHCRRWDH